MTIHESDRARATFWPTIVETTHRGMERWDIPSRLHKDRIVVFVNRADQLPNLNGDAETVKAAIEKRLRAEFPSLQIPVVYGSAWLGSLRLHPALRFGNGFWCVAIAWSTLAIKQHVALDVLGGAALGAVGAWVLQLRTHARRVDPI